MSHIKYVLKAALATQSIEQSLQDPRLVEIKKACKLYHTAHGVDLIVCSSNPCNEELYKLPVATQIKDLMYCEPKVLPDFNSLCRSKPNTIDVKLGNGIVIQIASCTFQARALVFGEVEDSLSTNFTSEYGQLGYDLLKILETTKQPNMSEAENGQLFFNNNMKSLLRFVFLAIQDNYAVTHGLLSSYGLIVPSDIESIFLAGVGTDPDEASKKNV